MDQTLNEPQHTSRIDDEKSKTAKRRLLRDLNRQLIAPDSSKLDSSLKKNTALIKRMRQSLASDNREQILKDVETLSLEKYVDELPSASLEGLSRCKSEKDVWSAVEIISAIHRRFPTIYTPALISQLASALTPPPRILPQNISQEQRDKDDSSRISRQRPVLRVSAELAIVGIIQDSAGRSGGEWMMRTVRDLLSNDPTLSSLPLLLTFLKSYSFPYLGITPSQPTRQQHTATISNEVQSPQIQEKELNFPTLHEDLLIEQGIRDRFKKMCEGYFDKVSKKLVAEHKRLQEQDRKNHEAYIRSGEIFEDRQQAYEKLTKGYEKLLGNCQALSELLDIPLPPLPTGSQKADSILISGNNALSSEDADVYSSGGKWEDEEERRFYEDIQDLKDFVPRSVLGIDEKPDDSAEDNRDEKSSADLEMEKEDVRQLEEELERLKSAPVPEPAPLQSISAAPERDAESPIAITPKATSPPHSPLLPPQGPSQLLTVLLARLSEATNRTLIDQAAVDFAFLNSRAARKRLVKFLLQVPKNRIDILPHYARLVATLARYMPDIGVDIVAGLDEEFRYLQRKKNVVKEFSEVRMKNISFLSNLTKFRVVPSHLILHMFKTCLDDFTGTNIDVFAMLLEGCGRFLLRSDETRDRFGTMLELMRRKQSLQHLDPQQSLMLENAYYQCNPPERVPHEVKVRTPMDLFIRHLLYDVLSKKTIDSVLKLIRKCTWDDTDTRSILFKVFSKPWKIKYSNISLLAMLTYDLQRYHPDFAVSVVDQVLEDIRLGLEQNVYSTNQRRVAAIKYLGELYIYRLFSSGIIFDVLWSLVTFGHPQGRPAPHHISPIDLPDDFFRIRLVCLLLDTCGMCFDHGSQSKKLDNFLVFFQYYIHCKEALPMDVEFMLMDSLEAIRPKFDLCKTIEEAAAAVDDMLNVTEDVNERDDSGDETGDEGETRRDASGNEDEDDEEPVSPTSPNEQRPPSPEQEVVISTHATQENLGPSPEADAEFEKELAKLVTDASTESRKVDKKTALALWESTIPPSNIRKRRADGVENIPSKENGVMTFTLVTKRGNKQQTRELDIPLDSSLAVQTRTAQLQDKEEQQQLKQLVLDYEQREEAEELKALGIKNRAGAIKIRYTG